MTESLKYGNRQLELTKSDKLIAVKPRPGLEKRLLSDVAPALATNGNSRGTIGGFRILRADAIPGTDDADKKLQRMREHAAVSVGTHVYHTSDDGVPFVPTGQLYVQCAPNAPIADCQALLQEHHLQIVEARGERELIVQVTAESENPVKTAAALQKSALIAVAEPDLATPGVLKQFVLPGDSMLKDQWHLHNEGFHRGTTLGFKEGADARVVAAWKTAKSLSSPTVIVAVIDDGFDLRHPDLAGDWKIVAPRDFTRNTNDPTPDVDAADWHGTACAGVAVGNADGTGILGAAPRCRLMPVRWGRDLSDRELEAWFGYVREQGAWVVSCSWGAAANNFPLSTRAHRAIERCAREGRGGQGCVICFAAGNDNHDINNPQGGTVDGFANHPDVIAVAASTSMDQRSNYSNFGAAISVCAPSSGAGGWGITTCDVMGQYLSDGVSQEAGYSPGDYTHEFGGTSSACPLVAGICALLLSIKPELTPAEVKSLIQRTARRIGGDDAYDEQGHSRDFGYGCIDADRAVAELLADVGGGEGGAGGPTDDQKAGKGEPSRQRTFGDQPARRVASPPPPTR